MHLIQLDTTRIKVSLTEEGTLPGTEIFKPGFDNVHESLPRSLIVDPADTTGLTSSAGTQLDSHFIATLLLHDVSIVERKDQHKIAINKGAIKRACREGPGAWLLKCQRGQCLAEPSLSSFVMSSTRFDGDYFIE
jgi:hypothetical protein